MKSSLIRRVLFAVAVAASAAACGDKPTTPELAPEPIPHRAVPGPAPVTQPSVVTKSEAAPMPVPTDYAEAMALGASAVKARDVVLARAMFDAASRLDDTRAEPQLELARLFLSTGEKKLALTSAKKATRLAPESSAAWNTLGRAQLARFAYDDAITAFEKAVDKNPKNAYAWNNLGFTMLELELWSEARNALEEATALPDATGYMFNNLGLAYEHLDMQDEALAAFVAGGEKGSADARYNHGRLESGTTVASVDVVITDVHQVPNPDGAVVEETGQIDEASIVDEVVKAEAAAEAAADLEHGDLDSETNVEDGEEPADVDEPDVAIEVEVEAPVTDEPSGNGDEQPTPTATVPTI
jgi:tetratricopeptide (TPR) repeat protein